MERIENTSNNSIVDGVIWKGLLKFFFPIMLGTLFQQLYNTVDTVVVGNFVGTQALAAVGGSSSQIVNLIIGFFVGLSSGATVIVSQYFGAREDDGVSRSVHTAMALALIAGALMTVIGLVFAPTMLELMDTPADTMADSTTYLRIVFLSMIPSMVYNVGSSILRAIGDSRRPLYFLAAACLVNVVLDLAFVLLWDMGVAGVAIATSIAQVVSAVMVFVSLCRAKGSYRVALRKIRPERGLLGRTVRIGLPTGLQSVLYSLSNIIIMRSINGFSTDTAAAWVAFGKVDAMFWLILSAFGVAIMTFVGQNYGARKYDRVHKSLKVCMTIACAASIAYSVVMLLFGRHVLRLFTAEQSVLEVAMFMLTCMVPGYVLYVPIELISGSLRGMGDTLIPTIITAAGICALRVAWIFAVVPVWHEILAITISYPISWLLTSTAFIFYYANVRRKLLPVREREQ